MKTQPLGQYSIQVAPCHGLFWKLICLFIYWLNLHLLVKFKLFNSFHLQCLLSLYIIKKKKIQWSLSQSMNWSWERILVSMVLCLRTTFERVYSDKESTIVLCLRTSFKTVYSDKESIGTSTKSHCPTTSDGYTILVGIIVFRNLGEFHGCYSKFFTLMSSWKSGLLCLNQYEALFQANQKSERSQQF